MVTILMMPAEIATLGFLKIKIFWNKSYDVIISVYEVTNEILSCDSNYVIIIYYYIKFLLLYCII